MYNVGFNWAWQNFAANGYAVLYTNPRGSTGYGQDFVNGIQYSYPGKDYDDLMAGVDAALAKGWIDERQPVRVRRQRRRRADRLDRRAHRSLPRGRLHAPGHQLALVRRHTDGVLVRPVPEVPVGRPDGVRGALAAALRGQREDADDGDDGRGRPADADVAERGVLPRAQDAAEEGHAARAHARRVPRLAAAVAPAAAAALPDGLVREVQYDVVGISSIIVNVGKVREMCRLVREVSPRSEIVVGGHVTAIPGIEEMIDADHIVKGEGIRWFREYLGEDPDRPIVHPVIPSSFGFRTMGLPGPRGGGDPAATIIPSVGCPMGCNFCTTSAFFGGKGHVVNFFERGDELYRVMAEAEAALGVRWFFIMDENFLLQKDRAMELLDKMKAHGKPWSLYLFSSANAIKKYTMRELVELGVAWIWLGLESPRSAYGKLKGTDSRELTAELQSHGIRILGSSIVGLEHHTPENIVGEIEHAVAHDTDFHQFMLYTPVPGTPLYNEVESRGDLLPGIDLADIHGQYQFNFRHPAISGGESKRLLDWAFRLDFEQNGPSLYRMMRTMYTGWQRYKDDLDGRVRERLAGEAQQLRTWYGTALWAMEKYLRPSNRQVSDRIRELRKGLEREFGTLSRVLNHVAGPALLWTARLEAWRFPHGRPLEPMTSVTRRNWLPVLTPDSPVLQPELDEGEPA
jgi:radical SAM superfamily enzyme YgiQ (UPF0313 family)